MMHSPWFKFILYLLLFVIIVLVIWIIWRQYRRYRLCIDCRGRNGRHRKSCSYTKQCWSAWWKSLFASQQENNNSNSQISNNSGNQQFQPAPITHATPIQVATQIINRQCCICRVGQQWLECMDEAGSNVNLQKCCRDKYATALNCCNQSTSPTGCNMGSCFG
jgi:hypothetical protein